MITNSSQTSRRASVTQLGWTLIPSTLIATVANVLFYYFATRILKFDLLVPNESGVPLSVPLSVFDVVLFSVIWALAAGVVYLIVVILSNNPIPIYIALSLIVLILSFGLPLIMPADIVHATTKGTLITMHIIGAISVVGTLVGLYRRHLSVS